MIDFSELSLETFQVLRAYGKDIVLYDEHGNRVFEPSDARRFYISGDNILVSILNDGDNSAVKVYLSTDIQISEVLEFVTVLRRIATQFNVLFNVRKYNKKITPRDFATQAAVKEQKEYSMNIMEGLYGTSKSSYLKLENARMIVRHSARVKENMIGGRGRSIQSIFVENAQGERFLFPVNVLSGARAMTQHVNHGGTFADEVGQQIIRMAQDFSDLSKVAGHIGSNQKSLPAQAMRVRESIRSGGHDIRRTFERMCRDEASYIRESARITEAKALTEGSENVAEAVEALQSLLTLGGVAMDESMLETVAKYISVMEDMRPDSAPADDAKDPDDGKPVQPVKPTPPVTPGQSQDSDDKDSDNADDADADQENGSFHEDAEMDDDTVDEDEEMEGDEVAETAAIRAFDAWMESFDPDTFFGEGKSFKRNDDDEEMTAAEKKKKDQEKRDAAKNKKTPVEESIITEDIIDQIDADFEPDPDWVYDNEDAIMSAIHSLVSQCRSNPALIPQLGAKAKKGIQALNLAGFDPMDVVDLDDEIVRAMGLTEGKSFKRNDDDEEMTAAEKKKQDQQKRDAAKNKKKPVEEGFEAGQMVKIVSGKNAGKSGMVTGASIAGGSYKIKPIGGMDNYIYAMPDEVESQSHIAESSESTYEVYGNMGMKSKPFRKSFKTEAARSAWLDKQEGNLDIHGYANPEPASVEEGKSFKRNKDEDAVGKKKEDKQRRDTQRDKQDRTDESNSMDSTALTMALNKAVGAVANAEVRRITENSVVIAYLDGRVINPAMMVTFRSRIVDAVAVVFEQFGLVMGETRTVPSKQSNDLLIVCSFTNGTNPIDEGKSFKRNDDDSEMTATERKKQDQEKRDAAKSKKTPVAESVITESSDDEEAQYMLADQTPDTFGVAAEYVKRRLKGNLTGVSRAILARLLFLFFKNRVEQNDLYPSEHVIHNYVDSIAISKVAELLNITLTEGKSFKRNDDDSEMTAAEKKKQDQQKRDAAKNKKTPVEETRMPASVIKQKQNIAAMTDAEKKERFKGKTVEQLKKMAWGHGYGPNSMVYAKYATETPVAEGKSFKRNDDDEEMTAAEKKKKDQEKRDAAKSKKERTDESISKGWLVKNLTVELPSFAKLISVENNIVKITNNSDTRSYGDYASAMGTNDDNYKQVLAAVKTSIVYMGLKVASAKGITGGWEFVLTGGMVEGKSFKKNDDDETMSAAEKKKKDQQKRDAAKSKKERTDEASDISFNDAKVQIKQVKGQLAKMSPFDKNYVSMKAHLQKLEDRLSRNGDDDLDEAQADLDEASDISFNDAKSEIKSVKAKLNGMNPFDKDYVSTKARLHKLEDRLSRNGDDDLDEAIGGEPMSLDQMESVLRRSGLDQALAKIRSDSNYGGILDTVAEQFGEPVAELIDNFTSADKLHYNQETTTVGEFLSNLPEIVALMNSASSTDESYVSGDGDLDESEIEDGSAPRYTVYVRGDDEWSTNDLDEAISTATSAIDELHRSYPREGDLRDLVYVYDNQEERNVWNGDTGLVDESYVSGDGGYGGDSSDVIESAEEEDMQSWLENGNPVKFKAGTGYEEPGIWTPSQVNMERGRCWVGDDQDRGWYVNIDHLEPHHGEDDDMEEDIVIPRNMTNSLASEVEKKVDPVTGEPDDQSYISRLRTLAGMNKV